MATDDDPTTVRDLRILFRGGVFVAIIAATCVGGIIAGVIWAVRHDARLENVEKWQGARDADARRELWRRDREHGGLVPPKS